MTFLAALRPREPFHLAGPGVVPPHRHAFPVDHELGQRPAATATCRDVGRSLSDEEVGPTPAQLGTAARHVHRRDPHGVRLEPRRPVVRMLVDGRHVYSVTDPLT